MNTLRRAISPRESSSWVIALLLLTVCLPGYSAAADGLIEPLGLHIRGEGPEKIALPAVATPSQSLVEREEALKVQGVASEKPPSQPTAQQLGGESKPIPVEEVSKVAEPLTSHSVEQQITAPPSISPKIPTDNKRLSLDFKGADLDDLLRLISEVSSLNIVAAHGLKDRKDRDVTVRLINVEWRQALDVILRAKGLSYEQDGNVLYVGSRAEIQKGKEERAKDIEMAALKQLRIEDEKRKVEEAKKKAEEERRRAEEERRRIEEEERRLAEEPPCTKVIHLAHTKAHDVKKHLNRLKTRLGNIELDEQTNTVIVNDVQSACLKIAAVASELDVPPKDPFVTKLLPFNYAKATDLKTHLTALKTSQGSIVIDERSSRIIVKDLPETVERIETFLKQIDIPTPQVLIEARIVEASRSFSQSLGIQWGGAGIPTTAGSKTGVTTFGGGGSAGPIQFPGLTPTSSTPFPTTTGGGIPFVGPVPLALNLPAITSGASPFVIGATIGSLANRFLVGVQLSAAELEGKIKTLSSPRVATQDNEEAEIKQGTQVPFTTIDSSGRTVVQFQDAFIKLKVKPHITPDGRVSMKVEAERSFPGEKITGAFGFVFPINTRKTTTNILVQNGSTVVIGGLLQSTESIIVDRVPFFGRIPGLSWLFKRQSVGPDERVELLIFLTPSVLQESRL
ncbi:secretin N-terminal domain-containing protein [Candidatus Methylomirabilis sp.]|uniref:secretin N-terminal domain-containing protein n=1 Tax=Candidatus Methylomirabilis sp. TaxID=2032687 RepID=UPI002A60F75F|nr:secretin N-terminal domain-containing protein [Candidatus Methylomirabilis sp.]